MSSATVTSKGQITLPKRVRDQLRLVPGDRLDFVLMDDGNFAIVHANRSVKSLKGILGKRDRTVTVEEMNAAIAEHVSKRMRGE